MEVIYNKYKGLRVVQGGIEGVVCGFTPDNLLLAIEQHPDYSFRKFGKEEHFIEEGFKEKKYRYCYVLESLVEAHDLQRNKQKV